MFLAASRLPRAALDSFMHGRSLSGARGLTPPHEPRYTYTHIRLTALCLGLPGRADTRKVKLFLVFTEARDSEWQWHQLGRMQVCTSLQTDNHASTPPLRLWQSLRQSLTQQCGCYFWGLLLSVCLLPIATWHLSSVISQFSYSNVDSAGFAAKFRIIFIK